MRYGGINMKKANMRDFMDFSSDNVDLFMMLVDHSGSMQGTESDMKKGLNMYKESFKNFPGSNSIVVSVSKFSNDLKIKPFEPVNCFDTSYSSPGGGTALYYSIENSAKYLEDYIKRIQEEKGIDPKATFICFSDGEPCDDKGSRENAKKSIEKLNAANVTTVFVAFGNSMKAGFGDKLGFQATIDVSDKSQLVQFLGVELSQSCKEQSKSMKGLGAEFFSGAVNPNSQKFSQTSAQAFEDLDWINDV